MTRCSWSPGFSRETTVRTFRTERHGKPKHVQEDHNSNDVVGIFQSWKAKMIVYRWNFRVLLCNGTNISRDDDSAQKVHFLRPSDSRVSFDVLLFGSQIVL